MEFSREEYWSVLPFPSTGNLPDRGIEPRSPALQAESLTSELQESPIEYSGLISFRNDWFDLLAIQGTLKSLLQHRNSKASILWLSAFFMVQFSHPYLTTGKNTAFTIQNFVGKVMSLLFNMLSRFVIAFLPRSKCLLISWLHVNSGRGTSIQTIQPLR